MGRVIASATQAARPALTSFETSSVDLMTGGEVIWTPFLVRVCDIFAKISGKFWQQTRKGAAKF